MIVVVIDAIIAIVAHVWIAAIDMPEPSLSRAATLLDEAETQRVASFRFEADRRRSLVARATLRTLLGRHLDRDPRALRFVVGEQGKPALAENEVEFNVSHSGGHVAIAISDAGPIGVDLEAVRATSDLLQLAERFFSPAEADVVRAAAESDRAARFFSYWTAKEAVIKAAGGGLSLDLRSFETDPRIGQPTAVRNRGEDPRLDGWNVFAMSSGIADVHLALASHEAAAPEMHGISLE